VLIAGRNRHKTELLASFVQNHELRQRLDAAWYRIRLPEKDVARLGITCVKLEMFSADLPRLEGTPTLA